MSRFTHEPSPRSRISEEAAGWLIETRIPTAGTSARSASGFPTKTWISDASQRPMDAKAFRNTLGQFATGIKNDGKPAVAQYAARFDLDDFHAAVLTPLKRVHSIALSQKERPPGFDGLNRHQVLHGESIDYDTELNSFKAISLLS